MPRPIPGDWFEGGVPDSVLIEGECQIETAYSFSRLRDRADVAVRLREGSSVYAGTFFDLGPAATVVVGRYALMNSVQVMCDGPLEIGDHALLAWNVLLMDSYREPRGLDARRRQQAERAAGGPGTFSPEVRPIRIGPGTWIGFDTCILPGVTIGEGSIVGARSVVIEPVPPHCVVAGNPARLVRRLDTPGEAHGTARG